jgi:hypothetical protein
MAHITADRVRQTTTSTTSPFALSGSVAGFRDFSSVLSTNDTFWYAIASTPGSDWEVGLGTYSAANTITRTTVLSSSNAGAAVTFAAGLKEVFITAVAGKFLQADSTGSYGNFTAGTITANNTVIAPLFESGNTISANYTITAGNNALTPGPVTIASGITVTVPSGSVWTIV